MYYKTLIGKTFGKWTVLDAFSKNNRGRTLCRCQCGRVKEVDAYSLTHGYTMSCGKCNTIIEEEEHLKCITANGSSFIFSPEDRNLVESMTWHTSNGYATALSRDGKTVYLHKYIMGADTGIEVDHINRNTLDNRKCNLRIVSHTENQWNKGVRCDNKTGYVGVCKDIRSNKYISYINTNGKRTYLGYHDTPESAALSYNSAVAKQRGEYAYLNDI